jgi:predicted HicB family RNase H-like nuclease
MGAKQRISRLELERLVSEGKGVSEIARELQASKSNISERCKRIGLVPPKAKRGGCKAVVLHGTGDGVGLDPANQLQKINDLSIEILNKAIRAMRKQGGNSITDPLSSCLRAMKEIRDQMSLRFSIAEKVHDMALREAEVEFREEVLQVIGEVDPHVREEILEKLKERRAARSALGGN